MIREEIKNYEQQRPLLIGQVRARVAAMEYCILRKLFDGEIVSDSELIQLLATILERGRHVSST